MINRKKTRVALDELREFLHPQIDKIPDFILQKKFTEPKIYNKIPKRNVFDTGFLKESIPIERINPSQNLKANFENQNEIVSIAKSSIEDCIIFSHIEEQDSEPYFDWDDIKGSNLTPQDKFYVASLRMPKI